MTTSPGRVVAVMQPYLFPYLGYYQLAHAADAFVFLDDVNFIKKGYVHRNHVLLAGAAHRFSVPVRQMSQTRSIAEHDYLGEWQPLLDLLATAYRKAPRFEAAMALVESVVREPDDNVARKNARSITRVFEYLGLARDWSTASSLHAQTDGLRGPDRILAIARLRGASTYVNAPGGRELYTPAAFDAAGIALRFIDMQPHSYAQLTPLFVPNLSMIDLLMHCEPQRIVELLGCYALTA